MAATKPRVVFISASWLVGFYEQIPKEIMEDAIFFFGSDRKWVFPQNKADEEDRDRQPTKYKDFPAAFVQLIQQKETKGLVHWLKPDCDFKKVSDYFEKLGYNALELRKEYWNDANNFIDAPLQYCFAGIKVFQNIAAGEHDYGPTMELLVRTNPLLVPILSPPQSMHCLNQLLVKAQQSVEAKPRASESSSTPKSRVVFISASVLVSFFHVVPKEIMEDAIFFFGSNRKWVFPEDDIDRERQPKKYKEFPAPFVQLIQQKETKGLVHWLKPDCDFKKVSHYFEQLGYKPFNFDKDFWANYQEGKFERKGDKVWVNLVQGEHDYEPVMELIYQSNPQHLFPVLDASQLSHHSGRTGNAAPTKAAAVPTKPFECGIKHVEELAKFGSVAADEVRISAVDNGYSLKGAWTLVVSQVFKISQLKAQVINTLDEEIEGDYWDEVGSHGEYYLTISDLVKKINRLDVSASVQTVAGKDVFLPYIRK